MSLGGATRRLLCEGSRRTDFRRCLRFLYTPWDSGTGGLGSVGIPEDHSKPRKPFGVIVGANAWSPCDQVLRRYYLWYPALPGSARTLAHYRKVATVATVEVQGKPCTLPSGVDGAGSTPGAGARLHPLFEALRAEASATGANQ